MAEKFDPNEYFEYIKSKKQKCTDEFLNKFYDVIEEQLHKAVAIKQDAMVRKLDFTLKTTEREHVLAEYGIDTFVYREDIEEFITYVENKVVKIIDLEFYPRTIPDEICEKLKILQENNVFDNYYIVFTDYTNEAGKLVSAERRRKDPILFGTFETKINGIWEIFDRFYYIGDWEDEYCDLTLSKMVDVMSKKGKDIKRKTITLPTKDEVNSYVHALEERNNNQMILRPRKQSWFKRVFTAMKG